MIIENQSIKAQDLILSKVRFYFQGSTIDLLFYL